MIKPNDQYNLDLFLLTGPIIKAFCTMELAGKWGIFQVYNTIRNPFSLCDEGDYCGWFVNEDRICLAFDPSVGCIKKYYWPKV